MRLNKLLGSNNLEEIKMIIFITIILLIAFNVIDDSNDVLGIGFMFGLFELCCEAFYLLGLI